MDKYETVVRILNDIYTFDGKPYDDAASMEAGIWRVSFLEKQTEEEKKKACHEFASKILAFEPYELEVPPFYVGQNLGVYRSNWLINHRPFQIVGCFLYQHGCMRFDLVWIIKEKK